MEPTAYLNRIGLDSQPAATLTGVEQLQSAHVQTVPFENLAIVGDPFNDGTKSRWPATGVELSLPSLYEKIVERERGGFCFELNGLFTWFLRELGVGADRLAARMLGEDGTGRPPANHHTVAVEFDRRYLVDVGMGTPQMRRPLPLDGEVVTEETGVAWRVVESERPDEAFLTQFRHPDEPWQDRYLFSDVPRELSYFHATCEYLASAPESPFTGDPTVSIATADGYQKLTKNSLRWWDGTEHERAVTPEEWDELRTDQFGLRYV